jgi:3-hydroxyacyl-CoA dehydrogenase
VAKSAFDAKDLGYLRPTDGITFNRDRLLVDAKAKALELAQGYRPPEPVKLTLPGQSGEAALSLMAGELRAQGKLTAHDEKVAEKLAEVLTGGAEADLADPTSEDKILELERKAFLGLLRMEPTLARIEHMLSTRRPLRN